MCRNGEKLELEFRVSVKVRASCRKGESVTIGRQADSADGLGLVSYITPLQA